MTHQVGESQWGYITENNYRIGSSDLEAAGDFFESAMKIVDWWSEGRESLGLLEIQFIDDEPYTIFPADHFFGGKILL